LLELTMMLCKTFPSLSPFAVRRERAHEVFQLVKRINNRPAYKVGREEDNQESIRVPAGDKWF